MTAATLVRLSDYGKGDPDPVTAVCSKHECAAPYGEDTNARGGLVHTEASLECIVCPLPFSDLIGTVVLQWGGKRYRHIYGGLGDKGERYTGRGANTTSYSLLDSRPAVVNCRPEDVAPGDTPIPVKDPRVVVVKRSKEECPSWVRATKAGKWELSLPGEDPSYFDKKGDAVETGHVRLAIKDWHAAR